MNKNKKSLETKLNISNKHTQGKKFKKKLIDNVSIAVQNKRIG